MKKNAGHKFVPDLTDIYGRPKKFTNKQGEYTLVMTVSGCMAKYPKNINERETFREDNLNLN